jgi:molybdopterin-guanine dinucleotide biosynthesis protein MobB
MMLGVYGHSNSGKTTLVVELVGRLVKKGYRVATAKHIYEPGFTIDEAGTDTYRHGKAGAGLVAAVSGSETAFIVRHRGDLQEVLGNIRSLGAFDVILVEGFKKSPLPKVKVGRIRTEPNTVFEYSSGEDMGKLMSYIERRVGMERILSRLPGLNCGRCGTGCEGLAARISEKRAACEDCPHFSEKRVFIKLDGREIPMGKFARDAVSGTLLGLCSSLKGLEKLRKARAGSIEVSITTGKT